jgi:hypothetical protein
MGLIGKLLSLFGGGSKTAEAESEPEAEPEPEPEPEAEPEPEPEPEAEEAEAEGEEEKAEDDGDMSTKAVAEMADPRRHEGEENTVHNRAKNPEDHAPAEDEAEAEGDEEEEAESGGMSTKAVAEMADPRRREGEENTVHNRAKNPEDHAPAEEVEGDEAEAEGDEEEEDDGDMSTKAVAEMADPRRREGEENTVHNRAKNPDDQRAT